MKDEEAIEGEDGGVTTYPLGAVARLTGLSPDVLRAWERRYEVVVPLRTSGGTRRYRDSDVERLRLVKAAVDAGHRISEVAELGPEALQRRVGDVEPVSGRAVVQALEAIERLDGLEAERLASLQLSALGPGLFAREFAAPLAEAIGKGWAAQRLCIASEHLGSSLLRSLLGASLRPSMASARGPLVVFGTLPGERHELGLLIAAIVSVGAGGNPLYLGPDLPVSELVGVAERRRPAAVAISVVRPPDAATETALQELRDGVAEPTQVWVGGAGAAGLRLPDGVESVDSVDRLEQRVSLATNPVR